MSIDKTQIDSSSSYKSGVTRFVFGIVSALFFATLLLICFNAYLCEKIGYHKVILNQINAIDSQLGSLKKRNHLIDYDYQHDLKFLLSQLDHYDKQAAKSLDAKKLSLYQLNSNSDSTIFKKLLPVKNMLIKTIVLSLYTAKVVLTKFVSIFSSTMVFILCGALGVFDGLLSRYIRKKEGGRESAFLFHRASRFLIKASVFIVFLYLLIPVCMNPQWIVALLSIIFFSYFYIYASCLKKYL